MAKVRRWRWIAAITALVAGAGIQVVSASAERGPVEIGFDAAEIVNPGRGQYRWGGLTTWGDDDGEYFPNSAEPAYPPSARWPGGSVSYYRFNWRQLEPSAGEYDFSVIDEKIAAAAARGERFGFRVMVVDSCCAPRTADGRPQIFPEWLTPSVNAWRHRSGDADAVIPDWNDPDYLSAMERLIKALGQRYDGDDRVGFVDMLGYGNFGEWHIFPWEGVTGPRGQGPLTDANAERLVDAHVAAFPRTTVLAFTPHRRALEHAMAKDPQAGLRVDSVGDASGGWAWPRLLDVPAAMQRWQTAPVVTEWATENSTTADQLRDDRHAFMRPDVGRDIYAVGRGQVMRWHLSLLSSGNFPHAWNGERMSEQQFTDWSMANKMAGYRYSVALRDAPGAAQPGQSVSISTTWKNAGVAPTYESWSPVLELRPRGQADAVARRQAPVDLRTLYAESTPPGSDTPAPATRVVTDSLSIPADVAPGEYDIVVVVRHQPQKEDPSHTMPAAYYDRPVALAQSGESADGSYPIGAIVIG